MNDQATRRHDAGLRVLVWMAALAAALIGVWLVMVYLVPAPTGLGTWTYPGASRLVVTNCGPIQFELLSTSDDFDSVARWYKGKLSSGTGDPAFMTSGGPFAGQRRQVKISLPKSGAARGTWYCELTSQGVTAAALFRAPEDATTDLSLIRLDSSFVTGRGGNQASPALNTLAYPAAKRSSGGAASGVSAFQFTSPDAPDRILAHYVEKFGAPSGAQLAPGHTLVMGKAPMENLLVRLPEPARFGNDHATTLLLLTPTNLCFVHLARATNAAATDMVLGVINR